MLLAPGGCLSVHKQKQLGCFITPGTGSRLGGHPLGSCACPSSKTAMVLCCVVAWQGEVGVSI